MRQPPFSDADWQRLVDPPRRNADREAMVASWFAQVCAEVILQPVSPRYNNVICRFPGHTPRLLVAAHYDLAGAGRGIVDNWTGIVIVTRIAAQVAELPVGQAVDIVAFAEEETGLKGALTYLMDEPRPAAMINIDAVGMTTLAIDHRSDALLGCPGVQLADELGVATTRHGLGFTSGDWEPFQRAGVPVVNLHSLTRRNVTKLHTRADRLSAVDRAYLDDAWQVSAALVNHLLQENRISP